jgi:hypothetical protein
MNGQQGQGRPQNHSGLTVSSTGSFCLSALPHTLSFILRTLLIYGHKMAIKIPRTICLLACDEWDKLTSFQNTPENLFSAIVAQIGLDLPISEPITSKELGIPYWLRLIITEACMAQVSAYKCLRTSSQLSVLSYACNPTY